jgi:hypothetical protein
MIALDKAAHSARKVEKVSSHRRIKMIVELDRIHEFTGIAPNDGAFDDDATHIMGDAFDAACDGPGNISNHVRELIAQRIIAAANKGDRDPTRLRDAGRGRVEDAPGTAMI